jgi:hypothetical protein
MLTNEYKSFYLHNLINIFFLNNINASNTKINTINTENAIEANQSMLIHVLNR